MTNEELKACAKQDPEAGDHALIVDADTATALQAIVAHPRLLQRPIVTYQNNAAIGRPPEHVLSLFKKA